LAGARLPFPIRVRTEGLERLPLVLAGREGLALALENLLANAAEAIASDPTALGQGEITIAGRADSDRVELTVQDTGPGISPEEQARIFEFDYSVRSKRGRLGFGLWWVKSLMTRLGGSVSVESRGPGAEFRGTTFRLRLPVA
jgi:signal transduction histidine kinase